VVRLVQMHAPLITTSVINITLCAVLPLVRGSGRASSQARQIKRQDVPDGHCPAF
jgi:hypothetical protein